MGLGSATLVTLAEAREAAGGSSVVSKKETIRGRDIRGYEGAELLDDLGGALFSSGRVGFARLR